jgi:hypothetical protein
MMDIIFNCELVEKENEAPYRPIVEDDARLDGRRTLGNDKDEKVEKYQHQVAAMMVSRYVEVQKRLHLLTTYSRGGPCCFNRSIKFESIGLEC